MITLRVPVLPFGTIALAITAFVLSGCQSLVREMGGPPPGRVAPALQPVLPYLKAVRVPVYLPDVLPTPPPGDSYALTAHATSDTYVVTLHFTDQPAPVNGTAMSSWSSYVGLVRGGPAAWVKNQAAANGVVLPLPSETPTQITLLGGLAADLYPAGAVRWEEGGWRYGVSADGEAEATQVADSLVKTFGPAGNPVGPGVEGGEVLREVGADGGNSAVLWTVDSRAYEVWGRDATAFALMKDLVRIRT